MPYISELDREKFNPLIKQVVEKLRNASCGEMNYVLSSIIWKVFDDNPSYTEGNELMGVLECVKHEFYRRKLAPYEDDKIKRNGDIQ